MQEGLEGLLCHPMFQTDLVEGLLVQQSLKVQPSLKVHHHGQRGQVLEVEVLVRRRLLESMNGAKATEVLEDHLV